MRHRLKRIVPRRVWSFARAIFVYMLRLTTWARLAQQVHGVRAEDRRRLRHALTRAPLASLRQLDKWQNPELREDALVVSKGVGRFAVRGRSDDLYFVWPARERAVVDALRRFLHSRSTFVDAGANIGFFTVLGSKLVGTEGKVLAIEMMPATAAILRRNISMNGCTNVQTVEAALADVPRKKMTAHFAEGQFGTASIAWSFGNRTDAVVTTTLDELLADVRQADLIKMDLEGAEVLALEGGRNSLAKMKAIIFEQQEGDAVSCWFRDNGFRVSQLARDTYLAERLA